MAYADQEMSGNKVISLIVVALIHVLIGYAFISGLAYTAFDKVKDEINVIKITPDEPEPEPEPPPPEETPQQEVPPPVVVPQPPIKLPPRPAPDIQQQITIPPISPPTVRAGPPTIAPAPAPPPPPPPPPPKQKATQAAPSNNRGSWVTTNDYPSRAQREEREGTTGFRVSVSADGRVSDCSITKSSGSSDLDDTVCQKVRQRARFKPAQDTSGNKVAGSYSSSVRWELPGR